MTGKTLATLERNVLSDLRNIFGLQIKLNQYNQFTLFGNTINCFGTDTVESYEGITGFTSYGHYGNEVTLSHPTALQEAIGRCSGPGARIFWDTNPDNPEHFIKKHFIEKADGERIQNWHFSLDDNTFLNQEYKENLKATIPAGVWYDRKILGLWVGAEGMIYEDFDPAVHVIDESQVDKNKFVEYIGGVDWGWEHLGVIVVLGRDYDGNYYLIEEIAEQKRHIDWWVEQKEKLLKKYHSINFYCDTAEPAYINKFGGIEADKSVMPGITCLAELMKKRKFFIVRQSAPISLEQIYKYRWNEKSKKDEPFKKDDDTMDAIRYAVYTREKQGNGEMSVLTDMARQSPKMLKGFNIDFKRGF